MCFDCGSIGGSRVVEVLRVRGLLLVFSLVFFIGGFVCFARWGVEGVSLWFGGYRFILDGGFNNLRVFLVLIVITCMVSLFRGVYMSSDKGCYSFMGVVLSFVLGMVVFLLSGDLYLKLVGWEMLGVIRFILIFYYCNVTSKVSALFTICINRLGDLGFILFLGF